MKEKQLKIVFFCLAASLLTALLLISRDAGISGDEEVHTRHAMDVYDYYASLGKDQDALNTPRTHLKYYGQSPDNIAVCLVRWFDIKDLYGFRHLLCSFIGWLTIMVTAWFARWLRGYKAAIGVVLLFALSPRFLGHLQNNLKDIPFALAYIAGLYYILKLTYSKFKSQSSLAVFLLIASIAFSVSIRAGGILLAFYLLFAGLLYFLTGFLQTRTVDWLQVRRTFLFLLILSASGYLCGLLFWPYALQNPVVNVWKSYQVMTRFPTTIQQIFEGKFIWSDHHPWYYLPKYMLVTIPLIVWVGFLLFLFFSGKIVEARFRLTYAFLLFALVFPVLFVIVSDSNLYGGWRHFLFIYPVMILLAAVGMDYVWTRWRYWAARGVFAAGVVALAWHPVRFMGRAHPYYYLYYNQLTGGLKGAYGKYETDYYYHTVRSGAEWLRQYLKEQGTKQKIVIGSNFNVSWYFREMNRIEFRYFTYSGRNDVDWDYAIICNSYIHPEQLLKGNFPPEGVIHTVLVEGVPVCAVVERKTKLPLDGAREYERKNYALSAEYYRQSLNFYQNDEHLYFRLGKSLSLEGKTGEAVEAVNKALEINDAYEPALRLYGQLRLALGDPEGAKKAFEKLIAVNRKYFGAYVELARILIKESRYPEARELLKDCLRMNARYKPAIVAMGDAWRDTDPEIAGKYYRQANASDWMNGTGTR